MNRRAWLFAGVLLAGLTGCSSFDSEYKQAVGSGLPAGSIEGPWEGRWESQAGHGGGPLRCMITKTGPDLYYAKFRAGYWGIFAANEETLLRVSGKDPIKATGESDLGALKGGLYRYEATITPDKLDATYKSAGDRGVWTMTRPVNK